MAENEKFLFVTSCSGVNNDLEKPVSVSVALDVERVGLSVGCPFASEFWGMDHKLTTRCTAPVPEIQMAVAELKEHPVCYHLNRKASA